MKRKKICICSDTISIITGLGKTALRIARGFYENGYDVCYFVITGQDSDKNCLPYYGEQYKNLFRNFEKTIYKNKFLLLEKKRSLI
ncbi:MAG TPA: hypothetical protein PKI46_07260 [Bacteroidales bacterium]|nr:hypothetical protein [Bacteroidales bacterium]